MQQPYDTVLMINFGVLHHRFSLNDIYEIPWQIAYLYNCSSCNAAMLIPVLMTFIHGPAILSCISYTVQWVNLKPDIVDQSWYGLVLRMT